jgi:hypothetical protein
MGGEEVALRGVEEGMTIKRNHARINTNTVQTSLWRGKDVGSADRRRGGRNMIEG